MKLSIHWVELVSRLSTTNKGRMSRLIDVNGEAVELTYDPDNSVQTTKDVFLGMKLPMFMMTKAMSLY